MRVHEVGVVMVLVIVVDVRVNQRRPERAYRHGHGKTDSQQAANHYLHSCDNAPASQGAG